MKFKFFLLLFVFLFSALSSAWAEVWTADNIQMVHLQDRTKYVCDPDGILSSQTITAADAVLDSVRRGCNVQLVFIIVKRVAGGDTFRMAQDVGNKYGVGDKDTRRGLVVVIAVDDKKYTIAPGKGLEAQLTDVDCGRIARAFIIPNMKDNNPDMAVLQTAKAILAKLKTGKLQLADDTEGEDMTAEDWALMIFFLLLCFGIPALYLIQWILLSCGIIKKPFLKKNKSNRNKRNHHDDFPPFIFFGGGGGGHHSGGGPIGGSFGGGSFGGGGSSGGW